MSTQNLRRPWSGRRSLAGAAVIALLAVVSPFALGTASGSSLAFHPAAPHAANPSSATGCGASGTIADKSGFEDADGNLTIDKAGCADWNGFAPVTWTGSAPYQTATKTSGAYSFYGVTDAVDLHGDTMYSGGVKQADECPSTRLGNVNNKDDLARIYVATSTDPVTQHTYLDLAWVRGPLNTTRSDVHVAFELNQGSLSCGNGDGFVHRTVGDILLSYDFQQGTATLGYSVWTGSTWTDAVTLPANIAEGGVFYGNGTTYDALKPSGAPDPGTVEFGEAGLDLTAAISSNGGGQCESFGTVIGESRTSGQSVQAQMKDYVGPAPVDISTCANPSLTTTQQPASGAMGATFKDTAHLSGAASSNGSGSITFKLYNAPNCGGSVLDTETVPHITGSGDYTTPTGYVLQDAGTYYWVASFSGDNYNRKTTTGCNDEPVTVAKASPSIVTTQQPDSGSTGDTFKDTATLSNGVHLKGTGTITFKLYSDVNCGGSVVDTETVPGVGANGDYTTPNGFVIPTAGTYYWVASFSGDSNNNSFTSGCNDEPVDVNAPTIQIVKTADAPQVSAGDPIGFTVTVFNTGGGDAKGVVLSDPLPTGPGLSWTIASQGSGWNGTCAITGGTLKCGPVTVPAATSKAGSTYTVHITSPTTAATGGDCPGTGVVDNTGTVTITNGGSDQGSASTCVAKPHIKIVKTADAPQVSAGDPIGFTLTVYNLGTGDAKGVTLNDVLPTNAGLNWTIASQGAGWNGTCAINGGTLTCGPVTVPAGTTQAGSTFTVHITSPTTAATGGDCPSTGVVDNTGTVTITNGGSDQGSASTCVAKPSIQIVKTADAAQVSSGDPIGFTVTVYNTGTGNAKGVTLSDPLPTNPGLSWTIASQGSGWNGTCQISSGTLTCGPVAVPAGTTQAGSTFTVHITSPTTAATGGDCPSTGVVSNTASVTTTNDGSGQSSASTCVAKPDIEILKTADAAQVNAGDPIGFTITVWNAGTGDAKGVTLNDPLPTNAGLNWKIDNQGAGWNGSCQISNGTLSCGPVTVPFGTTQVGSSFTVHISSTTNAATGGVCPAGSGVVTNTANVTTTNDGSGQSSASTCVAKPEIQIVKTPDAAQVNAGDPIGFTLTVYNTGTGDAKGVNLSDVLPANAGLSWTIASQGSGWNTPCAISSGTLTCGPVTVPAHTTQAGSTFTVHITSPTTAATGGSCPGGSGKVDNTGTVTTTNDGSGQSSAETCVAKPSIQIVKTADAAQVSAGSPIGFTLTVYNTGTGDAKGVNLSDVLPTNAGLSWTIDAQGAGWNSTCQVSSGTLTCGPVTVPAGTTQAGSTFTVHITSPTTAATGGSCPGGSGKVDNTGTVTTTNDGSGQSSAETCVAKPSIQIVKTADAAQVSAGSPIGFTLTVYNTGTGDAKGVNLSDVLPTNAGLSWTIDAQGAGWNNTCAINNGTLTCGPVTVPAGTTQAGSTFTVHITSPTTAATGGSCPGGSGEVDNTGTVTTTNDGSGQSSAQTCVAKPSIQIVKTADAAQVSAGDPIGFTLTVYNAGAGDAKGVNLSDVLPTNAGLSWTIAAQGAGWNNTCAINNGTLTCGPVTVPTGTTQGNSTFTVHITSPTTAATGGDCPSTGVVSNTGSVTTTNDGSGQSTASVCVAAPAIHIVKTADAAQVNAGDPIGFTLTVYNSGTGDAKGVTLNDVLPTNAGLNWVIAGQGSGWNNTCAINNGKLTCGPVTVPFGTTQVGSTFTVHITSTTTSATGGSCPGGSGVVDNTGTVTTTNDGSDHSSAETCVAGATVQILKTADAAQVAAGTQIGFTLVVSNAGNGDAKGVTLSDPLPTNTGLAWTIDSQGSGWNGTCAISGGTLTCGGQNGVTVPAGTTPAGSTFTVHIISPTTADTGGLCPETGVVDNTGTVSSTNAGTAHSEATTCVEGETDLEITKSGSPAQQTVTNPPYGNITWTITVTNKGPLADTHVQVGDPMPANNTYVSYTTSIGNVCTGGAILQCNLGTMQPGDVVKITLVTTPTQTGDQVNTANVVGDLSETDYTNNSATATVKVVGVVKPPACTLVRLVKPKQLFAGRLTTLHFKLTLGKTTHAVKGVRVRITGGAGLKGFHLTTGASSSRGAIATTVRPRTRGILYFKPIVTSPNSACGSKVGVTDVFTPPVTG